MKKSSRVWAADVTGTSGWQQMEVTATAPAYAKRIEVGCSIGGSGTAWFDDITIARSDQPEVGTVRGYTLDDGQIPAHALY